MPPSSPGTRRSSGAATSARAASTRPRWTTPRTFASTTTSSRLPSAFWRRSRTERRRKAATRPRCCSSCSETRSRARRDKETAREVCRELARSCTQGSGGRGGLAADAVARRDGGSARRRSGGGIVADDHHDDGDDVVVGLGLELAGGALRRHQRNGGRRERSRDPRKLGVPQLRDGGGRQLLLESPFARGQLAVRPGNGE